MRVDMVAAAMSVRAMTTFKSNNNVMARMCHSGHAEIYEYGADLKGWISEYFDDASVAGEKDPHKIGGLATFVINKMYEGGYRPPYLVYYGHGCLDREYEVNIVKGKVQIKIFSILHRGAPQKNERFLMYNGPIELFDPYGPDPYEGYE